MVTITAPICCHSRGVPIVITLAITICFMVWTICGDIGVPSKRALDRYVTEVALLAAMPGLSGSLTGMPGMPPGKSSVNAFAALLCLFGIAFAFGAAGTFKYVSNDYLGINRNGGGIVGLAGFMGGCALPILLRALMDRTGVRFSAFTSMHGVVRAALFRVVRSVSGATKVTGRTAADLPLAMRPTGA